MTVAIGMVCSDGVLVASDSQSSQGPVATRGQKVYTIDDVNIVWTASGTQYVVEEVASALGQVIGSADEQTKGLLQKPDELAVRKGLGPIIHDTMRICYGTLMPGYAPPKPNVHPFDTSFLFLGQGTEGKFFLECAGDGQFNWHTERGFYAIGSGGAFATAVMALMEHYVSGSPLPLEQGMQLAFRIIETTCEVSSMWVSGPVQIAIAKDGEAPRILGDNELEVVRDSVVGWKALERQTLLAPDLGDPRTAPKIQA